MADEKSLHDENIKMQLHALELSKTLMLKMKCLEDAISKTNPVMYSYYVELFKKELPKLEMEMENLRSNISSNYQ